MNRAASGFFLWLRALVVDCLDQFDHLFDVQLTGASTWENFEEFNETGWFFGRRNFEIG